MTDGQAKKYRGRVPTKGDTVEGHLGDRMYRDGRVDVFFDRLYSFNDRSGDKGVVRSIGGLHRVRRDWVSKYATGKDGAVSIPETEVQRYIARKLKLSRPVSLEDSIAGYLSEGQTDGNVNEGTAELEAEAIGGADLVAIDDDPLAGQVVKK